ncbi:unnamed protein product [Aphanomyces euteiches]
MQLGRGWFLLVVIPCYVARALRRSDDDDCSSQCRQYVANTLEDTCEPYRYKVPRPALYSRCTEAYTAATSKGCSYCDASPTQLDQIYDNVFHYCDQWGRGFERSYEPTCKDGYRAAITAALTFITRAQADRPRVIATESPYASSDAPSVTSSDVESAESIVQRHLAEARKEAIQDYERRDRHDYFEYCLDPLEDAGVTKDNMTANENEATPISKSPGAEDKSGNIIKGSQNRYQRKKHPLLADQLDLTAKRCKLSALHQLAQQ